MECSLRWATSLAMVAFVLGATTGKPILAMVGLILFVALAVAYVRTR